MKKNALDACRSKDRGFGFPPGKVLERRYSLGNPIGSGWEGEVYHLTETQTGIERVVKFYYPERNPDRRRTIRLARRFHRLRECSVVLQYHHYGEIIWRRQPVDYMVSELASGRVLDDFLDDQPQRTLAAFEALHLVQAVASGVAEIHDLGAYHGDIHEDNILVERQGLGFRVRLIDLYLHPSGTNGHQRHDVVDIAALLYTLIGGKRGYSTSPDIVKQIVCGRQRARLFRKFPNARALCEFMVSYDWSV